MEMKYQAFLISTNTAKAEKYLAQQKLKMRQEQKRLAAEKKMAEAARRR